jgi:hypothetical protein
VATAAAQTRQRAPRLRAKGAATRSRRLKSTSAQIPYTALRLHNKLRADAPLPPTALPRQRVAHYHVAATQHAQPCARANATSTGAIAIQRSACVPSRQAQLPATRRRCSCTRCSGNRQRASAMPTTTTHCSARNEPRNASAPLSTRQLCWGPNRAKCTELR